MPANIEKADSIPSCKVFATAQMNHRFTETELEDLPVRVERKFIFIVLFTKIDLQLMNTLQLGNKVELKNRFHDLMNI